MRWLRIRVRTLMIAVAALAMPLGICMERRSRFLSLAERHEREATEESSALMIFDNSGPNLKYCDRQGRELSEAEALRRIAVNSWHDLLALKYRRAAQSPWRLVEPDPPMPE